MNKILILYYSYEGSTEKIAEHLAENLKADIEKVTPVKEMKCKGFGKYIIGGFQATSKKKPKLNPIKSNFDDYDIVLIGSPVWAGTMTPPIYSLLEKGIIKDKKIGYFYCSAGGADKVLDRVKASIEKYNTFISSCHLEKVFENCDQTKDQALIWAKEIL